MPYAKAREKGRREGREEGRPKRPTITSEVRRPEQGPWSKKKPTMAQSGHSILQRGHGILQMATVSSTATTASSSTATASSSTTTASSSTTTASSSTATASSKAVTLQLIWILLSFFNYMSKDPIINGVLGMEETSTLKKIISLIKNSNLMYVFPFGRNSAVF